MTGAVREEQHTFMTTTRPDPLKMRNIDVLLTVRLSIFIVLLTVHLSIMFC